ncbi:MAG: serine hydroxymethyltransferase, partial [Clostridia bacterium]|nr:serine hydroxymethyltransferase [Clostridia bacterium]
AEQIVKNAKVLADRLLAHGFRLVSGGTDNHLILFETFKSKGILGRDASRALDKAGIVTNCNPVPFDPNPPFKPSGVRIGTPAATTRGFKEPEMVKIAHFIKLAATEFETRADEIRAGVTELCSAFPLYR